ncbi:hypothetical protein [Natronorubrum texcoconense]|uniref:hypothetical protein n=1 Tax=Natronorubrum texcoconense TaxID=1095776 RepID=UPI001FE0FBB1|nr:hypothetical protein [Natronorubrum texcoconense]
MGALSVGTRESRLFASDSDSGSGVDDDAFDPATDGFGFDNYSTPPVAPDPTAFVSESALQESLSASWETALGDRLSLPASATPESQIRTVAERLYANANRLFGTKGYCYGMAMAAQWYFEEPSARPVDRESTSEIEHVNDPLEDRDSSPVRDDIERFHRSQFTDLESWLRRRVLLRPEWIDYRSQADEIREAIDEYGSAGLTISGENVLEAHYVLLYDYDVSETGITFAAYDPNDTADEYANRSDSRTVGIDTTSDEPLLGSYEGTYDRFLFDRTDRAVSTRIRADQDR